MDSDDEKPMGPEFACAAGGQGPFGACMAGSTFVDYGLRAQKLHDEDGNECGLILSTTERPVGSGHELEIHKTVCPAAHPRALAASLRACGWGRGRCPCGWPFFPRRALCSLSPARVGHH